MLVSQVIRYHLLFLLPDDPQSSNNRDDEYMTMKPITSRNNRRPLPGTDESQRRPLIVGDESYSDDDSNDGA